MNGMHAKAEHTMKEYCTSRACLMSVMLLLPESTIPPGG